MADIATTHPQRLAASDWVQRWSHLLNPGHCVLDIACGAGRHLAWFARRGNPVWGIDRDLSGAADLAGSPLPEAAPVNLVQADIENGAWPLLEAGAPRQFDAVVVTNYLWRPLFPVILSSLAPGGLLLYETFANGNESVGRPTRPDFLLREGELLSICASLQVIAYENGFKPAPDRFVQRIAARRPNEKSEPCSLPIRHPL